MKTTQIGKSRQKQDNMPIILLTMGKEIKILKKLIKATLAYNISISDVQHSKSTF